MTIDWCEKYPFPSVSLKEMEYSLRRQEFRLLHGRYAFWTDWFDLFPI